MKLVEAWSVIKQTGTEFWKDKGPRLGAALAFYTALSLSPLMLFVIAIAGPVFGEQAARGEVAQQIRDAVGEEGAQAVQAILAAHKDESRGILMTIVGLVTMALGASGVFGQLQDALDTIWEVPDKDLPSGWWAIVKDRFISFSVVCGLAFLLLVSLVFSTALSALNGWMEARLPLGGWGLRIANQALSLALTTGLFAFIFKVLPHQRVSWSDVWHGAIVTAVLFTIGKYLIGLYFGYAAPGSAYGAAGSFVVLLIWVYYSTQILLFGAEFTQVFAHRHGSCRETGSSCATADTDQSKRQLELAR
ncbi:MAG TPA: YihY/virulence factor BrkB family protein [Gemmataceae bacterium]|jgi:membrane protein|nr:YihY/virulence factor BrkB family protein [Gemmataceae bacterium]